MSRKARTILTLKLTFPVPPGYTQAQLVQSLKELLRKETSPLHSFETVISILSRQTDYL